MTVNHLPTANHPTGNHPTTQIPTANRQPPTWGSSSYSRPSLPLSSPSCNSAGNKGRRSKNYADRPGCSCRTCLPLWWHHPSPGQNGAERVEGPKSFAPGHKGAHLPLGIGVVRVLSGQRAAKGLAAATTAAGCCCSSRKTVQVAREAGARCDAGIYVAAMRARADTGEPSPRHTATPRPAGHHVEGRPSLGPMRSFGPVTRPSHHAGGKAFIASGKPVLLVAVRTSASRARLRT